MASSFRMPRGSKKKYVTRFDNYAVKRGAPVRGIRRLVAGIPGQPGVSLLKPGVTEGQGKRGIRVLHKVDPTKGLSMPEAKAITNQHFDTGTPGGYRGARVVAKSNDPQVANKGKTVVRPPRLGRLIRR